MKFMINAFFYFPQYEVHISLLFSCEYKKTALHFRAISVQMTIDFHQTLVENVSVLPTQVLYVEKDCCHTHSHQKCVTTYKEYTITCPSNVSGHNRKK